MQRWRLGTSLLALIWLAACATPIPEDQMANATSTPNPSRGHLAPDITSDTWLNSPPLTPADLRGKVVVVEFWTFG
jgi:hypothetical protein